MGEAGIVCGACGTVNEAGARFCQECGAPLAAVDPGGDEATAAPGEARSPAPAAGAVPGGTVRTDAAVGGETGPVPDAGSGTSVGEVHPGPSPTSLTIGERATGGSPADPLPSPGTGPWAAGAEMLPGGEPGMPSEPASPAPVVATVRPDDAASGSGPGPGGAGAARPAWSFPPPVTPTRVAGVPPPVAPAPAARAAGGNWFRTAAPRQIVTLGLALLLLSCVATTVGRSFVGGGLDPLAVCVGPVGVGLVVYGLVRMAGRRPERRF